MGNIVPQGTEGGDGDLDGLLDDLGLGAGIRRLLPDESDLLPYLLKDIPGVAGLRLRARWYGRVLGGLGEGCTIGPGITFVHPERVFLANGVRLAGNSHLEVPRGDGRIELGAGVYLGWGSFVNTWMPGGYLRVDTGTWIGAGTQIWGHVGVEIGAQCPIAPGLLIVPYQHAFGDVRRPIMEQGGSTGPVVVEDDVYLGMGVRILPNLTIGRGAVVGAGSVVRRSLPPFAVAAGVPARVLRLRQDSPAQ